MTINDAETGDIYADATGKLWRILDVVREPTIVAEEVEGTLDDPNAPKPPVGMGAAQGVAAFHGLLMRPASIVKQIRRAPTGADIWKGFQRIFRHPAA